MVKSWVHDQLGALPIIKKKKKKKKEKESGESNWERYHTETTSEFQSIFFRKNDAVIWITQMTTLSFFFLETPPF